MRTKEAGESPAPITLGLRLVGGGYLVWLAFQLVRNFLFLPESEI